MAFVSSFGGLAHSRRQAACQRVRPCMSAVDDSWDSWSSYRDEMRSQLEARRAAAQEEVFVETAEDDEADAERAANFWENTFRTPNESWNSDRSVNNAFDGAGIRFDFFHLDEGSETTQWFAEKQAAYSEWVDNRGYYKRTRYVFRDQAIYEEPNNSSQGEWSTRIDYNKVGAAAGGGQRTTAKKAKRKKITIDLFSVLGLASGAEHADVRRAYRNLARQYHPDRNQNNPVAAEKMSVITFAYSVLKDPESRGKYERGEM
mmetsp:Transcript_1908/g.5749  ORF Transcript_1908/g.5749 Transcript_1908/m.5749 type:complete len:260 (-) Transcript_1908:1356-2135(-)